MRDVTVDNIKQDAQLVHCLICCLDKAWSVLDMAAGGATAILLKEIDAVCKMDCKSGKDKNKKFVVYRKRKKKGDGDYYGRTGGLGSEDDVLRPRDRSDHRNDEYGQVEALFLMDNHNASRGLEQWLIDMGGELGNKGIEDALASISKRNPQAALFPKRSLVAAKNGAGGIIR